MVRSRIPLISSVCVLALALVSVALVTHARDDGPQVIMPPLLELSPGEKSWVERRHGEPGVHHLRENGRSLVMVTLGARLAPGFRLEICGVKLEDGGRLTIWVSETKPGSPGTVSQEDSYPYKLVGIRGWSGQEISVLDCSTGQEWVASPLDPRDVVPSPWPGGVFQHLGLEQEDVIWLEMREGHRGELRYTYSPETIGYLAGILSEVSLQPDEDWEDFVGWDFSVDLYLRDQEYLRLTFAGKSLTVTPVNLEEGYRAGPSRGYIMSFAPAEELARFFWLLD